MIRIYFKIELFLKQYSMSSGNLSIQRERTVNLNTAFYKLLNLFFLSNIPPIVQMNC